MRLRTPATTLACLLTVLVLAGPLANANHIPIAALDDRYHQLVDAAIPGIGIDPGHGGIPCMPSDPTGGGQAGKPGDDDPLCPRPTPGGASCVAHGLIVLETDLTGGLVGDAVVDLSQSRAWTQAIYGPWPGDAFPQQEWQISPPTDPQAHADAAQHRVTYTHPFTGTSVSASVVSSQCDVQAVYDERFGGLYTRAYGRGTAADVSVTSSLAGTVLDAEVLDFELDARGFPWFTMATADCDVVKLTALNTPIMDWCPAPWTGFGAGVVSVTFNEQWGPLMNTAGQWVYGGAALHVQLFTGVSFVDVYVGYVAVAVTGGPAGPIFNVPDGPALIPGPF